MNLQERAEAAYGCFEQIKRGDETIWTRRDDAPDWTQELTFHAHGDMAPDDYRYEFVVAALEAIAERGSEDASDYAEDIDAATDIYTHDRLRWLASNLSRPSYVDEAIEDFGHHDQGIVGDIGIGQYREREEVLSLVLEFLSELDDDDDDDDDDDNDTEEA